MENQENQSSLNQNILPKDTERVSDVSAQIDSLVANGNYFDAAILARNNGLFELAEQLYHVCSMKPKKEPSYWAILKIKGKEVIKRTYQLFSSFLENFRSPAIAFNSEYIQDEKIDKKENLYLEGIIEKYIEKYGFSGKIKKIRSSPTYLEKEIKVYHLELEKEIKVYHKKNKSGLEEIFS